MKRVGFKRPVLERRPAPPPRPLERPANYAGTTTGPAPKDAIVADPGKHAPTVAEARWLAWIVEHGCIACMLDGQAPRPTAVHHIIRGGQRLGHMFTLPLCDPGHHQGGQPLGLVSRHPWKARFETRYGSEQSLLAYLQEEYSHVTT